MSTALAIGHALGLSTRTPRLALATPTSSSLLTVTSTPHGYHLDDASLTVHLARSCTIVRFLKEQPLRDAAANSAGEAMVVSRWMSFQRYPYTF